MKTSDCTGSYDYERSEAQTAGEELLADLCSGYYSPEQFEQAIERERTHWAKILTPEGMADFTDEFNKTITLTGYALQG